MEEGKKVSEEVKPILQKANPYKLAEGEEDAEVEAFARGELEKFQREQKDKEAEAATEQKDTDASEENVIIPVSVVKNFATKRYGGQNEIEAVTSFIADLENSAPGMDNTMEQQSQPVPPDTQMADSEGSMMQSEIDEIDSGMMEA